MSACYREGKRLPRAAFAPPHSIDPRAAQPRSPPSSSPSTPPLLTVPGTAFCAGMSVFGWLFMATMASLIRRDYQLS